jgi:putative ABC transport system ATP-binding protein
MATERRSGDPLIVLDRLTKWFEEGGQRRDVLHELSATFGRGEFVVLLGKSGSGKSTLLNLIGGIDTPSSGRILFGDQDLTATWMSILAARCSICSIR